MVKTHERENSWAMVLLAAGVERVGKRLNILYRRRDNSPLASNTTNNNAPAARANSIYPPVYLSDPITQSN